MTSIPPERLYDALTRFAADCSVCTLDVEGRVASWYEGARRIMGYEAPEILGQPIARFYSPEDLDAGLPSKALAVARSAGRYEVEAWRLRRNGGRFWAHVVVEAVRDDAGELLGYVKITRDITERVENEKRLQETREQLLQSQKLDALGQMTSGIAHDFNNLLQAILGAIQMAQRHIARDNIARAQRLLKDAVATSERAASLTHRLLAFSRHQPLRPKVSDLNERLRSTEEILRRMMGKKIQVDFELAPQLPATLCDPNQFENAILNLALNARDAMPEGGRLTIATRCCAAGEDAQAQATGRYVCVCVTDTGVGMPPEVVSRAFDPFFTTKPQGQGTGLGLSMVYGFAKQSEGWVKISSEVGRGTVVELCLPETTLPCRTDEARTYSARPSATPSQMLVLVAEDEPVIRNLVLTVLTEWDYRTLEAADGVQALEYFRAGHRIDLLVSDIGLPKLNGLQLVEAARVLRPDLKVLFMTGYADSDKISEIERQSPGTQLLHKPFDIDMLVGKIGQLLQS